MYILLYQFVAGDVNLTYLSKNRKNNKLFNSK